MKRLFDFSISLLGLIFLFPLFLVVAVAIWMEDGSPVFFRQTRVGRGGNPFRIHKFRTMFNDAENRGLQITTSNRDCRITKIGYFLRKFKIDELPQIIDVIAGDMSLVGPRPEVPTYTSLYTLDQQRVLTVRPWITDYASIYFYNENEILAASKTPEETYIKEIMPAKIRLNLEYINTQTFFLDLQLIGLTFLTIIFRPRRKPHQEGLYPGCPSSERVSEAENQGQHMR